MDNNREYVTLNDMEERSLAKRDPAIESDGMHILWKSNDLLIPVTS